jgi:hypothetical protein
MASAACSPGAWATEGYLPHPERRINQSNESKALNNQFGELTKSLARSVTRRAALKKFGAGLAGMALACFGLANKTEAKRRLPAVATASRDETNVS